MNYTRLLSVLQYLSKTKFDDADAKAAMVQDTELYFSRLMVYLLTAIVSSDIGIVLAYV